MNKAIRVLIKSLKGFLVKN